jgi:hypothetical protein
MYPPSLLWWLGGAAILFGILGLIGLLVLAVDRWAARHAERHGKKHGWWGDDGHTRLRLVFEVLSAVLVVTSLLVAIYSDSPLLRGVAGIAMIVLVAAATVTVMSPDP